MPIVASRSKEIQKLVAALGAPRPAEREAAAARLRLLGSRATLALVEAARAGPRAARAGALQVLGLSDDPRARRAVLATVADGDAEVAGCAVAIVSRRPDPAAALALAGALRHADPGVRGAAARGLSAAFAAGVAEATEPIVGLLLDEGADEDSRLLALEAVARLPRRERTPLLARLQGTSGLLGRRVAVLAGEPSAEARSLAAVAADLERLPKGAGAVPRLHDLLRRLPDEGGTVEEEAWDLRLRLHRELAERRSGIALYDLRAMLGRRPPRDGGVLLELVARIGDASFVPLLTALVHDSPALTQAGAQALAAIVARERLRKTHRAVRAVKAAHRLVLDGLWSKAVKGRK
ncbi:MAG TPA: hypothetical protein VFM88_10085 [Vicinamibacteria bacterium]|nr:hypothetical protein [Vicinamibacteria bacterium]